MFLVSHPSLLEKRVPPKKDQSRKRNKCDCKVGQTLILLCLKLYLVYTQCCICFLVIHGCYVRYHILVNTLLCTIPSYWISFLVDIHETVESVSLGEHCLESLRRISGTWEISALGCLRHSRNKTYKTALSYQHCPIILNQLTLLLHFFLNIHQYVFL